MVNKSIQAIIIVTGDLGKGFIKEVYNGLDPLKNISSAVNYCSDIHRNAKYFEDYPVVKKFATEPQDLVECVSELV